MKNSIMYINTNRTETETDGFPSLIWKYCFWISRFTRMAIIPTGGVNRVNTLSQDSSAVDLVIVSRFYFFLTYSGIVG